MVRSISVQETNVASTATGKTFATTGSDAGARFNTPQMSSLVAADPSDLNRVTSFGDAVIKRETDLGGPVTSALPKFDLTSRAGRNAAVNFYKDKFRAFSQSDAYVAGYNVRFDIQQMIDTARQIPEFMNDPEAVELLGNFEARMFDQGGMIDVLDIARTRLSEQVKDRMSAALASGDDEGARAALAIESLLSPRSMQRVGDVGEKVSLFGLENILESTDFLERLARDGGTEGMELINLLAGSSSSHIDVTDNTVTRMLLKFLSEDPDGGISLLETDGTSPISPSLGADALELIARARINVRGSKAYTTTVNIADPRVLTESALEYLYETPEAFRRIKIEDTLDAVVGGSPAGIPGAMTGISTDARGVLSFTESGLAQFQAPGQSPITISNDIATSYVRGEFDAIRAVPTGVNVGRSSVILSTGINPIQQTNVQRIGEFFSRAPTSNIAYGSSSMSDVGSKPVIQIAKTIGENESDFFSGMSATGNIAGFSEGVDPSSASGISGIVRHPLSVASELATRNYTDALYRAGVASASLNPTVRSAVVSLSGATAGIGAQNTTLISGALLHETDATGAIIQRTADDVGSRVIASSDLIAENMSLLSDIGIVHMKSQKIVSSGESLTAIPYQILQRMESVSDTGARISMPERLAETSAKVRLSAATRSEALTPTVNVIYGGSLGRSVTEAARARASVEAESFLRIVTEMPEMGSARAMVAAGLAESEDQATRVLGFINSDNALATLTETFAERGFVIGGLSQQLGDTGAQAADAARIIDNLTGGISNDIEAVQRGLQFTIGQMTEGDITLAPAVADEVISEAQRVGGAIGRDLIERSSGQRQVGLLQGAIRRGVDDPGFFGRLRDSIRSARPSEELAASGRAVSRRFRDMDIMEKMKFIKPKAYMATLGVGALSAGYYLARRSKKQDLYNEVMEQQEFEQGPLSISDFNDLDQQLAMQTSSRRDPLVTAGVVGNLDRNKTSHYKMGPDKYNHLFGA